MTTKHYDWKNGPDLIQQHSIAKHNILQAYLSAYFQTLASSPARDELRLTLVDGFAGGGLYIHQNTREPVKGSPFIFLNAVKEASFRINESQKRKKPLKFDISYFFVEKDHHAFLHLNKVLIEDGYKPLIGNSIHLLRAEFQEEAAKIIQFIKNKSPRKGRSIFALDQYGYKDVPTGLIRSIFSNLPSAEVILTFGVDSFLNFASDKNAQAQKLLNKAGLPNVLRGKSIEEIRSSEYDWRLFIQSSLYHELVTECGAKHYTPFFIRNRGGHGDYWLVHMSQHHRARDVMTEVHWDNHNHFIHYGGAGLDMFQIIGYDPDYDSAFRKQIELGFEFDEVARKASIRILMEQIPRLIYAHDEGMSLGELFATTCNLSPASASIYREAIELLVKQKQLEVIAPDQSKRYSSQQMKMQDQIVAPMQRPLLFL